MQEFCFRTSVQKTSSHRFGMRERKLSLRFTWILSFSGTLRSVGWLSTDVSGLSVDSIFKGQMSKRAVDPWSHETSVLKQSTLRDISEDDIIEDPGSLATLSSESNKSAVCACNCLCVAFNGIQWRLVILSRQYVERGVRDTTFCVPQDECKFSPPPLAPAKNKDMQPKTAVCCYVTENNISARKNPQPSA
jgi:hypothetical protein